jgi:hypothetical protein
VRNDHKKAGRVNLIRHLLRQIGAPELQVQPPDADVVFRFEPSALTDGRLEP